MGVNFITSYSGASFRIEQDILIKQCRNLYASGLMQLAHQNKHFNFATPKIYSLGDDHIAMQYLPDAVPLPVFFNTCTKDQVNSIMKDILNYIRFNKTGNIVFIRPDVIYTKVAHIASRLNTHDDIKMAWLLVERFGKSPIEIETGTYHGDLTFNNILVNNNDYTDLYFIDFLPGYIPSFYLDVIKLQQECHLNWSSYFIDCGENYQYALELLRPAISRYMSGKYSKTLRLMEALNYLRILPYAKSDVIENVLRASIKSIIA